ncbi:MAG: MATE family efflux transporter [Thermoanaerobaculia bacterium]|nr:MATE family efflux transporter [Thermoanaerobaculia bacterium]
MTQLPTSSPNRSSEIDISYRHIVAIAWPLLVSQLSFTAMGLIDTMMVGRLGVTTLAAVGLANFLTFWLLSFFFGLLTGVNTLVAQAVGAQRNEAVGRALWQGLYASFFGALLLAAFIPVVPTALAWTGADRDMLGIASNYMIWRLVGVGALGIYLAADNFYRGLGETRIPMICGVAQLVVNCGVNYLLIFGKAGFPALGATGAAIGTAVAQLIMGGVLIATILLRRRHARYRVRQTWRPHVATVRRLVAVGLPVGVQMFMEMGGFTIFTALVARLGAPQMAATNAVLQVWSFALMFAFAISVTATTLSGQAVGAGEHATARRATWRVLLVGAAPMVVMCTVFLTVPEALMSLFAEAGDAQVLMPFARPLFLIAVIFLIFDLPFNAISGALRGAGDTKYPMYVSIAMSWLVFVPAVWFASPRYGVVGAWWCLVLLVLPQLGFITHRFQGNRWFLAATPATDSVESEEEPQPDVQSVSAASTSSSPA